jgi:hypothetical protein
MVKICPKCKNENPDDAFWCENCKNRLIQNIIKNEKTYDDYEKTTETKKQKTILPYEDKLSKRQVTLSMLKIPFAIIFIAVLIFSTFYFITNVVKTDFDWDQYGGCPWDENNLPWDNSNFPWVQDLSMDNILNSLDGSYEFTDIGQINNDYWFIGDSIKTQTGWTFTITKVEDCSYTAKVLDYYVYNKGDVIYQPSEIFSPIDIFLGFEDILEHPEKYPYRVVSHFYRGVFVQCTASNAYEQNYFMTHCTNTHIIPHSQEVINTLMNIEIGDIITISGSYVDVYGSHSGDNTKYSWTTDTVIGNPHCEIILLDSVILS